MSVLFQAAPYQLRESTWAGEREHVGEIAIKTLERFAPGSASSSRRSRS
jgi:hypothetical protein